MKILSLTQPWATLMAIGAKRFETRSWGTQYLGDVAIHAAKGFPAECRNLCRREPFAGALDGHELPLGVIVCVVELIRVVGTHEIAFNRNRRPVYEDLLIRINQPDPIEGAAYEFDFGDYSPGRKVWITRRLRCLRTPIAARGAQGLRDLDPSIARQVTEAT